MARGGARLGAGRKAGKSANTSTVFTRARARARVEAGNQRPWPAGAKPREYRDEAYSDRRTDFCPPHSVDR